MERLTTHALKCKYSMQHAAQSTVELWLQARSKGWYFLEVKAACSPLESTQRFNPNSASLHALLLYVAHHVAAVIGSGVLHA